MPKFVTIGYGTREGYDRTPPDIRDEAHSQDQFLIDEGALVGIAETPMQVRNPDMNGTVTTVGPYLKSDLPVAGFGIIEAADMADAIDKVSTVPCAVAHGVVEVWPLRVIG